MTVMYIKCGMIMGLTKLSQTTGLSISHAAVWNVIQALGDKLVHDEKKLVETGKKEDLRRSQEAAFYGGGLRNLCEGLGSARKRPSRGFRRELHSSNEGGRMFEPQGRVCAGA